MKHGVRLFQRRHGTDVRLPTLILKRAPKLLGLWVDISDDVPA